MKFEVVPLFDKQFKKLAKKYNLIKNDLNSFIDDFDLVHKQAIPIKNDIYKVRFANSNKNRGKSAGYKMYYYVKIDDIVYLITIYDKSEIQAIDETVVINAIREIQ